MDQARATKQLIDFQKAAFDNMLGNMILYWDQAERASKTMMDQASWLPEEGKRFFLDWVKSNKKGVEQFKQAVSDGYNRVETCFVRSGNSDQSPGQ